jgi:hypothetical protein
VENMWRWRGRPRQPPFQGETRQGNAVGGKPGHGTDLVALTPTDAPMRHKTRKTPTPPKTNTPVRCRGKTAARTPQAARTTPPAPAQGAAALLAVSKASSLRIVDGVRTPTGDPRRIRPCRNRTAAHTTIRPASTSAIAGTSNGTTSTGQATYDGWLPSLRDARLSQACSLRNEGWAAEMPKTSAERQRAWRDRRARLIATLQADHGRLRAELADVRGQLADALAETERLAAQQCRHPAAAVDGNTCHACGTDIW